MKNVTISDVAKHAGVSKSTVSQFLNGRYEYMSEETKKRIEEAIKELDYQPNILARSLKQKTTSTIGVIVANILHEFSTQIIRSIEDYCNMYNFNVIVCNADDDPTKEKKYIETLRAKQVDGLIIFPTGDNKKLYEKMEEERYPVVFVDRIVEGLQVPSILLNNEQAAELAVEHFLEKGYERLGIITSSLIKNITPRIERVHGFKQALQKRGLPVHDSFIKGMEVQEIQKGLHAMLQMDAPVQAVLAGNDRALKEILKYVNSHSIKIPEELAIIGIDDVSFAEFYAPKLTTIAQPTFEMGKEAARILLDMIKGKTTKTGIIRFEPKLLVRDSC